jgi:acyl-CoA thioesterase-1
MVPTWIAGLRLAAVAALLGLGACRGGEAPAPPPPSPPAATAADEGLIVAVGDSLTAGFGVDERDAWPAQLERRLRADGYRWKVVNAGISGETSAGARARIDWVLGLKPDIVVVETGANDGLRGLPPLVLRQNLDAILATLRERRVVTVVAGMRMLRNLGERYTAAFAEIYPDLAGAHDAILIPFFLEGVAANPALNQADGLHPTAEGYRVVTGVLYPAILEAIVRSRAARERGR